jgi:predicted transcriptional regulator
MYVLPDESIGRGLPAEGMRVSAYAAMGLGAPFFGVARAIWSAAGALVLPVLPIVIGLGLLAALDHPARRRIYEHLRRLPGDHLRSVARSLHLALGTTRYHLDVLRRQRLIEKKKANGRARFYVTKGEVEANQLFARHWENRDVRLRVLDALRRMEMAPPATIARSLGVSRQLAFYHLASLERAGLARRHGTRYQLVRGR